MEKGYRLPPKGKCLCGRDSVAISLVLMPGVYSNRGQIMEEHEVCEYHAAKAIEFGYKLLPLKE